MKPEPIEKLDDDDWFENAPQRKDQVAIIGFWRKDKHSRNQYYCYNYFYVPNPCVRELSRSERNSYIHGDQKECTTISICQVLFKG